MANQGLYGFPTGRKENKSSSSITYQNFTRNFGLSPSDMGKTVIINTHNGYNLVLPDCRQLSNQRFIVIKNNATTNLLVTNNGGVGIKTVAPNSILVLACTDISSANGVWSSVANSNLIALYAGNTAALNGSASSYEAICSLDSTHAVVFYQIANQYYANVLTVSGSTISVGATATVNNSMLGAAYGGGICALDSTHAVATYNANVSGSNPCYANVLTISGGSTISVGATTSVASGTAYSGGICALDSTHAVATYTNGSNNTSAVVLTISGGSTISVGAPTTIVGSSSSLSICSLDATHAVATYTSSGWAYTNVLTISGTTITIGTPVTLNTSGVAAYPSICALDATHAVAFYQGTSNYAYANVLTISGSTISAGSAYTIDSTSTSYESIAALSSTTALVFYKDGSGNAVSNILTISGSTITPSIKTTVYSAAATAYESVCNLPNTTSFVAFYQGLSSYAYANVLSYTQ